MGLDGTIQTYCGGEFCPPLSGLGTRAVRLDRTLGGLPAETVPIPFREIACNVACIIAEAIFAGEAVLPCEGTYPQRFDEACIFELAERAGGSGLVARHLTGKTTRRQGDAPIVVAAIKTSELEVGETGMRRECVPALRVIRCQCSMTKGEVLRPPRLRELRLLKFPSELPGVGLVAPLIR